MKRLGTLLTIGALGLVGYVFAKETTNETSVKIAEKRVTWEYKTVDVRCYPPGLLNVHPNFRIVGAESNQPQNLLDALNAYGKEGWELVEITRLYDLQDDRLLLLSLKRPKI